MYSYYSPHFSMFVIETLQENLRSPLVAQLVKNPPAMRETWVQSLGWEDPLEKGKGYPLQCSGLENSLDWILQGVAKSQTRLSNFHSLCLSSRLFKRTSGLHGASHSSSSSGHCRYSPCSGGMNSYLIPTSCFTAHTFLVTLGQISGVIR